MVAAAFGCDNHVRIIFPVKIETFVTARTNQWTGGAIQTSEIRVRVVVEVFSLKG